MKPDDGPAFVELLGEVAEVYGRDKLTPRAARIYFNAVEAHSLSEVRAALARHVKANKFFPRPADILEQIEGSAEDRARAAWRKVLAALSRCGTWESVRFDDPRIHAALENMGGWISLGGMETKELPFREKDFAAWYAKAERAGADWNTVPGALFGRIAATNRANGHALPPVYDAATGKPLNALPQGSTSGGLGEGTTGTLAATNSAKALVADLAGKVRIGAVA